MEHSTACLSIPHGELQCKKKTTAKRRKIDVWICVLMLYIKYAYIFDLFCALCVFSFQIFPISFYFQLCVCVFALCALSQNTFIWQNAFSFPFMFHTVSFKYIAFDFARFPLQMFPCPFFSFSSYFYGGNEKKYHIILCIACIHFELQKKTELNVWNVGAKQM